MRVGDRRRDRHLDVCGPAVLREISTVPRGQSAEERQLRPTRAHKCPADRGVSRLGGKMSSWVVLLVALAACLRFGSAQSEPLPLSLVDLVMNSPISSMKDLQKLLDIDSVEEVEDDVHSNDTHRRLPRSLVGVQVAQQAMCKVRTEVMEVTRSMLDRRNAHFMLWPLCVEVQRCSGCCNSRNMQCVPVVTDTRHLQMTKVQFFNKMPIYEKVIIPVEDHVTCSCQSHSPAPATRAKATPPPPPPRLLPKVVPPSQSKEELHRHDDLKKNQRLHLEDRDTQQLQWESKFALSHTQGAPAHTPPHTQSSSLLQSPLTNTPAHASREEAQTLHVTSGILPALSSVSQSLATRQAESTRQQRAHLGSGDRGSSEHPQRHGHHHPDYFQSDEATPQLPHPHLSYDSSQSHSTVLLQSEGAPPHSSQLEAPVLTYTHVEVIGQSSSHSKLPDRQFAQSVTPSIYRSPSEVAISQSEKATKFQRPDQRISDMENQQKQSQHHHHHHHQTQHSTQATGPHQASTHRAVTNAPSTMPPTPQPPPPPTTQRRRRRKHKRRMSKSAMRAMIMVMS